MIDKLGGKGAGWVPRADQARRPGEADKTVGLERAAEVRSNHGDRIEQGQKNGLGTYGPDGRKGPDEAELARLWAETDRATEALRSLVEKLIAGQGKTWEGLLSGEQSLEVDESTRAQAAALVADDGPMGVEAVSDRIVDFAIALSGGDVSKLETLREAIDKGFAAAKEMLGGTLPEISSRTYDAVMEKLHQWAGIERE